MLRKLTPASFDETATHSALLRASGISAANVAPMLPPLLIRFAVYDAAAPFSGPLRATPPELQPYAHTLHNLYDSQSPQAKEYRAQLMKVEQLSCPYCGNGPPTTLDHILPRSKFEEFSMYAKNLIPCCPECNRIKSNTTWEDNRRCFLNPYHDDMLEEVCIHLSIRPDATCSYHAPVFTFDFHWSGCTPDDEQLFALHFEKLRLPGRLRVTLLKDFRSLHRNIKALQGRPALPAADIRSYLEEIHTSEV